MSDFRGNQAAGKEFADLLRNRFERIRVGAVYIFERLQDARLDGIFGHETPVCCRGDMEPARYGQPGPGQSGQRHALTTDRFKRGFKGRQIQDERRHGFLLGGFGIVSISFDHRSKILFRA